MLFIQVLSEDCKEVLGEQSIMTRLLRLFWNLFSGQLGMVAGHQTAR